MMFAEIFRTKCLRKVEFIAIFLMFEIEPEMRDILAELREISQNAGIPARLRDGRRLCMFSSHIFPGPLRWWCKCLLCCSYVSAMVPVKTMKEYDILQEVIVLFSDSVQRWDIYLQPLCKFNALHQTGCLHYIYVFRGQLLNHSSRNMGMTFKVIKRWLSKPWFRTEMLENLSAQMLDPREPGVALTLRPR